MRAALPCRVQLRNRATPPSAALLPVTRSSSARALFWGLASGLVIGSARMLTPVAHGLELLREQEVPRSSAAQPLTLLILFTISLLTVLGAPFTEPTCGDKHVSAPAGVPGSGLRPLRPGSSLGEKQLKRSRRAGSRGDIRAGKWTSVP